MLWWFCAVAHRKREQRSPGSLPDLISMTVNLNRKLGYLSSHRKIKVFKDRYCQKHSAIFSMSDCERIFFAKTQLQTTNEIILKKIVRLLEEFQARFDLFQELKPCFSFLVNLFNVNVSVMTVQLVNRLLQACLL